MVNHSLQVCAMNMAPIYLSLPTCYAYAEVQQHKLLFIYLYLLQRLDRAEADKLSMASDADSRHADREGKNDYNYWH